MLETCVRSRHGQYIAQSLLLTFFIPLLRFSKFIESPPDVRFWKRTFAGTTRMSASVVRKALAVDQRRHRLTHYNNPNYTAQILALSLGVKW